MLDVWRYSILGNFSTDFQPNALGLEDNQKLVDRLLYNFDQGTLTHCEPDHTLVYLPNPTVSDTPHSPL